MPISLDRRPRYKHPYLGSWGDQAGMSVSEYCVGQRSNGTYRCTTGVKIPIAQPVGCAGTYRLLDLSECHGCDCVVNIVVGGLQIEGHNYGSAEVIIAQMGLDLLGGIRPGEVAVWIEGWSPPI